jgi:hypothetical protein
VQAFAARTPIEFPWRASVNWLIKGEHLSGSSHVFYETQIEGVKFKASMISQGPYLHVMYRDGRQSGTALGVSTIDHIMPSDRFYCGKTSVPFGAAYPGWWIAKYGNQPMVDISFLSETGRHLLMQRFGIQLRDERKDANEVFRQSDAFRALCRWVVEHPRIAKRNLHAQTYLQWGDMVEEALESECAKTTSRTPDTAAHTPR